MLLILLLILLSSVVPIVGEFLINEKCFLENKILVNNAAAGDLDEHEDKMVVRFSF